MRPLPLGEPLSHLCVPTLLTGVEGSGPKTINIKQYLNTNNCSSNLHKQHNLILKKYFYKQFSCHHHINKSVFATNLQFNHTIKTKLQTMLLIFNFFPFLKMFKISLLDPDMKKKNIFATNLFKINIF